MLDKLKNMKFNEILQYSAGLICILLGGLLAYLNRDGWGWFLFIGLLLFEI